MSTLKANEHFKIEEFNLEEFTGSCSIGAKVKGYWSDSCMSLYVRVQPRYDDEPAELSIEFSHSSGGRDTDEVKDDLEAALYHSEATQALAIVGYELHKRADEIVAKYQEHRDSIYAKRKKQLEAEQAKIDNDSCIGDVRAEEIIEEMYAEVKEIEYSEVVYCFRFRGSDKTLIFSCKSRGHKVIFNDNIGNPISKAKAMSEIAKLAELICE